MSLQNTPLRSTKISAPYCAGLMISVVSDASISVSPGACSDSDNNFDMISGVELLASTAVTGINGIDIGEIAASKVYYVHLVTDYVGHNVPGLIISLSANSPYLPVGYQNFRRIGWVVTDASSHLIKMHQSGNGLNRTYSFDEPLLILSSGTSATFAAIDMHTKIPTIDNMLITVQMGLVPVAAGDALYLRSGGSSATNGRVMIAQVAATSFVEEISVISKLVTGVPTIEYKVSAGTGSGSLISVVDAL